jgi:hypothetical protein
MWTAAQSFELWRPNVNLRRRISELCKLADSDDWWDREIAGFALRDLIEDHFVEGMKLTIRWPKHRSARIRGAACQSLMQRKAKTTDDRLRSILKRLEVLINDDDIYVRKCCGPYVVAYLAFTYPRIVIPWLKEQAHSSDLNVRTNVAKAFSQSLGARRPQDGVAILKMLARIIVGASGRRFYLPPEIFSKEASLAILSLRAGFHVCFPARSPE